MKKINKRQFVVDIINKELSIVNGPHFDSFDDLSKWANENKHWFLDYSFKTKEQFFELKKYFYEHFYDYKPKRTPKRDMYEIFNWFMFMYGLKYDFEYEYNELYDV